MREFRPGSTPGSRRGHRLRSAALAAFEAKPTRRAGQILAARYRIEGRIGSGSTADVYLAADLLRNRPVVVKQLTDDAMANDELRRRFLSEAETLAGLSHPNIVRVLDYGASLDERPFLVMEPLRGETLGALLARRPHQPVELALMIATEAAKGLAAAHAQQVFHRDVKPDNLFLIGPRGAPTGVKVIDFGMAKLPRSNGTSGVHTVLGTIEYMAPEQVMADPVDARTDVYGLGILLFRLLTAHLPFEAPLGLESVESSALFSGSTRFVAER
ncbi:MAG: serine/threonine-protein kinase [Polyangiaceae bacterium]